MSGVTPNQCYICYQAYNNERMPLILTTCGHTYCKECLLLILNSENREIICPECKQITIISENNDINCLPKNRSLLNLIIFNEEKNYSKKLKKESKLKNKNQDDDENSDNKKIQLEKYFEKYEEVLIKLDHTYKNLLNEHNYLNEISEILIMKEVDDVLDNFIDVINNHREDLQKKIKAEFAKVNLIKNFGKSIETLRKRLNCYISYFKLDGKTEEKFSSINNETNNNNDYDDNDNDNDNNNIFKKKFNSLKEKKMKNFISGVDEENYDNENNDNNDNDNSKISDNQYSFNTNKINEQINLEDFLIKKNSTKSGQNFNSKRNNNNNDNDINQEFKIKLEEELNFENNNNNNNNPEENINKNNIIKNKKYIENPLNIPFRNSLDSLTFEKMLKENDLSDLENEIQFSELYLLTLKQFSKEIYNPCQFFFVNKFQIEKLCHDLKKMLFKACDFDENIIKYKIKDLNNYEEKKFIKEIQEACSQSNKAKLKFLLTHFRINPNFIYSEVLDQITNHQGEHPVSNPLGVNNANNINSNSLNFHNISNINSNQNPFHSLNIFDPISARRNINHAHRNLSNRYNSNILNTSNIKDKVFNFYSYLKSFKDKTELNDFVRFLIDEYDYLPLKIENEVNFDMKLIKELDWKMELGVI